MKRKLEYEYKIDRYFKDVKEFYEFVRLDLWLLTGHNLNEWVENFEAFENPSPRCDIYIATTSFDRKLIVRKFNYSIEYYLKGCYHFRMKYSHGRGECMIEKRKGAAEKKLKKISKNLKKVLDKAS